MCFGGGGSPTPEPRQDVKEETEAAKKEEEQKKIDRQQKALEKEAQQKSVVATDSLYPSGGIVYRKVRGRGSLMSGSGKVGYLNKGKELTQTGLVKRSV